MAQTTIKNHFPDFERGKKLSMLEYVYAKPLVSKGGKKRKALGVDGEFRLHARHILSTSITDEVGRVESEI